MKGAAPRADEHAREAAEIIQASRPGSRPSAPKTYLAAAPVVEALDLAR